MRSEADLRWGQLLSEGGLPSLRSLRCASSMDASLLAAFAALQPALSALALGGVADMRLGRATGDALGAVRVTLV